MLRTALPLLALALILGGAAAFDMRGLKRANKNYLASRPQRLHAAMTDGEYMAQLAASTGAPTRRLLSAADGGMSDLEKAMPSIARTLMQFNDTNSTEPEPVEEPEPEPEEEEEPAMIPNPVPAPGPREEPVVTPAPPPLKEVGPEDGAAVEACSGKELYGPFPDAYVCPFKENVDCAADANDFGDGDGDGQSDAEGTWYWYPNTQRGNWADGDMHTFPVPFVKFAGELEALCENNVAFATNTYPSCVPKYGTVPYATVCVFGRLYKLDYWVLWYMSAAAYEYADSAEFITTATTLEADGAAAALLLYQAAIFIPTEPSPERRRHLLQEDASESPASEAPAPDPVVRDNTLHSVSRLGGEIEALQNLVNVADFYAPPPSPLPPPPPSPPPWEPFVPAPPQEEEEAAEEEEPVLPEIPDIDANATGTK